MQNGSGADLKDDTVISVEPGETFLQTLEGDLHNGCSRSGDSSCCRLSHCSSGCCNGGHGGSDGNDSRCGRHSDGDGRAVCLSSSQGSKAEEGHSKGNLHFVESVVLWIEVEAPKMPLTFYKEWGIVKKDFDFSER